MADVSALHGYLRDPAVTQLTSYPAVSVPRVEAMVERYLSRWVAGEPSKWAVALPHDDQLVGTCGFNEGSQAHRWAELAFDLAQPHWGKGLMRQAVAGLLEFEARGSTRRVAPFSWRNGGTLALRQAALQSVHEPEPVIPGRP